MTGVRTIDRAVAAAVRDGLGRPEKQLPAWLLYDANGSALFERITELPGYYLTRAEREILTVNAVDIVRAVGPVDEVVELGAGIASKSEILLAAFAAAAGPESAPLRFQPVDVSPQPLALAAERLARSLPAVEVTPLRAANDIALDGMVPDPGRLTLFLGSSVGNLDDEEAVALLRRVRRVSGALLIGVDLRKDAATLLAAYDDPVTEAFLRNVLVRLNRELDADFALGAIRYVPVWNEAVSRMEMYLESARDQVVHVNALGLTVPLRAGERIHVEDSRKYDLHAVDELLGASGFERTAAWTDSGGRFVLVLGS